MADDRPTPPPRIGSDEWVAQVEGRKKRRAGAFGRLLDAWERLPFALRLLLGLALLLALPLITSSAPFLALSGAGTNAFILSTLNRFLVFAILAIGLTVVVGYAGLLDLGYIAFYGLAGYLYAYTSSGFVQAFGPEGVHLPSLVSIPLIVLVVAGVGWLLGATSLRLSGDYLAIVTLGFGLVFVQLALTLTRVRVPGVARPVDLTGGPNGINRLDDISVLGFTFDSSLHYYYLLLGLLALVFVAVYNLSRSRIGRAWRAIREDGLAAEVMGVPTARMKLLAFAVGAGVAALAGAVDAAWQGNVVPVPRYSSLALINLYAMVVLGGTGSLVGAVLGAFIFTVLPEVLRDVALASYLFYGGAALGLFVTLRPRARLLRVLGGVLALGLTLKGAALLWPALDAAALPGGSWLNAMTRSFLVLPEAHQALGNLAVVLAIAALLGAVLSRGWRFEGLLVLALYLGVFGWETRLVLEPAATRILIVGATLVVLMIVRPQGLLGKPEVRVV
jgi:ABC-type branched-subunit amino acid transport system permease subunit